MSRTRHVRMSGRSARRTPVQVREVARLDLEKLMMRLGVSAGQTLATQRTTSLDPPEMHPLLAFIAFFRVLFGRPLPESIAPKQLPAPDAPEEKERVIERVVEKVVVEKPKTSVAAAQRDGALVLMALMQREGWFVDFMRDSVDGASDADIGAAAREVHRG